VNGAVFGFDSAIHLAVAFLAATIAGVANAIAGGGTVVAFPALVWLGLPYVAANATNSVALWPGSVSAAWSYHGRLRSMRRLWFWLGLVPVALAGGAFGAWLLIRMPPAWFRGVAPFLVVGASIAVAIEPMVRARLATRRGAGSAPPARRSRTRPRSQRTAARTAYRASAPAEGAAVRAGPAALGLFGVSLYGGYFGAGIGILMLLLFGGVGVDSLHDANALKNAFAAVMKVSALVYFVAIGAVVWPAAIVMAVGAAAGGYLGGRLIQRVDERVMRGVVVAIGVALGLALLA